MSQTTTTTTPYTSTASATSIAPQHVGGGARRDPAGREHLRARLGTAGEVTGLPARSGSGVDAHVLARTADAIEGDATLRALEALSDALGEMENDRRLLAERLRELHRQRAEGRAWRDILSTEEPPGTMQLVTRMLACLARASGTLRRELVEALRREGQSIPAIAKLFGVTHQRVSNLLRRPSD